MLLHSARRKQVVNQLLFSLPSFFSLTVEQCGFPSIGSIVPVLKDRLTGTGRRARPPISSHLFCLPYLDVKTRRRVYTRVPSSCLVAAVLEDPATALAGSA